MSETIGSPRGGNALSDPGPSGTGPSGRTHTPVETVREAYSFACLSCGYGWEQAYDIEHHAARDGHVVFEYHANGVRVPSPLLKPTCPGCGGHTVRIMREGRVAVADQPWQHAPGYAAHGEPAGAAGAVARPVRTAPSGGRWARFWARLRG
ncbi:hypothetical protein ACFCX4_15320 [Kitasatospora sp. NPDC056327]|uniref:hypothetical protein n=1 Tax=Kitasatospora sp. NPDC056327 TaxID=3345785 RepID=UPI0035E0BBFC